MSQSDTVTIKRSDIVRLCKAHAKVGPVTMGTEMDRSEWIEFKVNCEILAGIQEEIGVEVMDPAKIQRGIDAFEPERKQVTAKVIVHEARPAF
jgi:hypothetical protein